MSVCNDATGEIPCAGVATRAFVNGEPTKCAIHGSGFTRSNGAGIRCSNCRRQFVKGEWYQERDGGQYHVKQCTTHKDVIEAREREKAGKPAPMRVGARR